MSLTHVQTMLNTLKQFNDCEISVTFHDQFNVPVISVCYEDNSFEITFLKEEYVEKYEDIEATLLVIDKTMNL